MFQLYSFEIREENDKREEIQREKNENGLFVEDFLLFSPSFSKVEENFEEEKISKKKKNAILVNFVGIDENISF